MLVNYWDKYTEMQGQQNVKNYVSYIEFKIIINICLTVSFIITPIGVMIPEAV